MGEATMNLQWIRRALLPLLLLWPGAPRQPR